MQFSMVFRGVDQASKVMGKIMASEKKLASAVKSSASKSVAAQGRVQSAMRATARAARKAFEMVTSGAAKAKNAVVDLHKKTLKLAGSGLSSIGDGFRKSARGMALGVSLLAAAYGGAAVAGNQLVGTASQFEKFQTILETTEGSAAKANVAMGWVTNFAVKTPYELDQVTDSFVKLRAYGLDPTQGLLRSLGDTSAAMGKPLMQAVEAVADAVTGENERLKEFGIRASKSGNTITYAYTNAAGEMMKASVDAGNRIAIQQKLMEIMNEKYAGSMDRLSRTWDGMMSNLADMFMKFQLMIMDTGLFDWMKDKLAGVLETINQMEADGSLKAWATEIGDTIKTLLDQAWTFATGLAGIISELGSWLSMASDWVGGWERLAAILGAMAFAPTLLATAQGLFMIGKGMAFIATALAANPITLAIMAIAGAAWLIYDNWSVIGPWFEWLWDGIKAAASKVWEWMKTAFSWTPLGMIIANWDGITAALSAPFESGKAALSAIWEGIKTLFGWTPLGLIIANWDGISAAMSKPFESGKAALSGAWDDIKALFTGFEWPEFPMPELPDFGPWIDKAGALVSKAIGKVSDTAGSAWTRLRSVFGNDDPVGIAVRDPASIERATQSAEGLGAALEAARAIDMSGVSSSINALIAEGKGIETALRHAISQAQSFLGSVSFHHHGARMMETLAAGMQSRAQVVVDRIRATMQQVRDHLPSSPAKVGPLSDIHRLKFGETIARSIKADPMVRAMRHAAAATMAAAVATVPAHSAGIAVSAGPRSADVAASGPAALAGQAGGSQRGGGAVITYSPTITISGEARSAEASLRAQLEAHSRDIKRIVDEEARRQDRRRY
ncbi:tape measure protein [Hoeflea alexandrii]|uniref:tape measure protein n=1 Tax=Hoeflea alexandrii TaxID=288436 RepID=UPI0035D05146